MPRPLVLILVGLGLMVGPGPGCAARRAPAQFAATAPTTRPATDPRAMLALDQIEPTPQFPPPTTAPSGQAPLEALELFARARDARLRNQPFTAINLLEQAARLDPYSCEVNLALGSAYQRVGNLDKAIETYERAVQVNSQDLLLQAELGRSRMQQGDMTRGIQHFRLARMTDEYSADEGIAAAVDYRLGLALQQAGFDRAALEVYDQLLKRIQGQRFRLTRTNAEILPLLSRPQILVEQIGRLYEKHGQWDEALRAYEFVAQRQPDDFEAHARVVTTLRAMGRHDDARRQAADLVQRFRASVDSLALLRETYRSTGEQVALVEQLRQLHQQRPDDRGVLFALAEALSAVGRESEAHELLMDAADGRNGDPEIISRVVKMHADASRLDQAARVLVQASAARPKTTSELLPLWTALVSPGRNPTLRVADIQGLAVPESAQAAKLFFAARVADSWARSTFGESLMKQATVRRPPFAPAYRAMMDHIWGSTGWTEQDRLAATDELIAAASEAGDAALVAELKGLSLLARKNFTEAQSALAEALRLAGDNAAPDTQFVYASSFRMAGNFQRFETLMWRLATNHPQFSPTYSGLIRHHTESGNFNAVRKVKDTWLAAMPHDPEARIQDAVIELQLNRRPEAAQRILLDLFSDHPDRLDVLVYLHAFYSQTQKLPEYITLMERECAAHPYNFPAMSQLVELYASQQRQSDAMRLLDGARAALQGDADRLYFLARLYHRIQQPQISEQVLEEVLSADPGYASAANDLGYTWADAGKNLERAESMIRRAAESEPLNPMFLDSLGWVMYKRGRFQEAKHYLQQAVEVARATDPVVLDHLGDALYRLSEPDAAARQWQLALERIAAVQAREQHNVLRLQLDQKLRQLEQKQPVTVAPVAANVPLPGQAKN